MTALKKDDLAPDFNVQDITGTHISLKKYNLKHLLIVFLRYAGCPWCNLAIHRLSMEYQQLHESKCEVVVFVQSTKQNIKKNIYDRHALKPPFTVIADPDMKHYKKYGIGTSVIAGARQITQIPQWVHSVRHHGFKQQKIDGNLFLAQAFFLVSPGQQRIVIAQYGKSLFHHETFTEIYSHLFYD